MAEQFIPTKDFLKPESLVLQHVNISGSGVVMEINKRKMRSWEWPSIHIKEKTRIQKHVEKGG